MPLANTLQCMVFEAKGQIRKVQSAYLEKLVLPLLHHEPIIQESVEERVRSSHHGVISTETQPFEVLVC